MAFVLTNAPIALPEMRQALDNPHSGAVVCFEGVVRNHHRGRGVLRLQYSAYEAMAVREGEKILQAARARFALDDAAAIHRLGELAIGDVAVWVGVSAAHRGAAFDACRYVIDEIKENVPIWKHEFYSDGGREWTANERAI